MERRLFFIRLPRIAGLALAQVRVADNRHDPRAIRVEWRGRKLGNIPRLENATLTSLIARGHRLVARIAGKRQSRDSWARLAVNLHLQAWEA